MKIEPLEFPDVTRRMELPSDEIGKAAGRTGLIGKIRRSNLDTLNLRYLFDVQMEILEKMLDYRSLGFKSEIGMEI